MDDHLDLIGPQAEQMARLDHLQRLVEHGGAVDGDLDAHRPVRMRGGDFGRDCGHLFACVIAEWSAGRGQDDALDCMALVFLQHLEDGVVFAVDRQQRRAMFGNRLHHHLARRNQRFLVGERDSAAALDCGHHRSKTSATDNCRHRHVDRPCRSFDQRCTASCCHDPAARQRGAQFGQARLVADDG